MIENTEKKGKMKVTVEFDLNEELMGLIKDAMSKASTKIPEMMRHPEKISNNKICFQYFPNIFFF